MLVDAARSKSAAASIGLVQLIDLMQTDLRDLLDDELGDSLAPLDTDRVLGIEVDCADLELTTVVGINQEC